MNVGLVLSRKEGERIMIDGEIVVTVVEVRGDKVRLGIKAPNDIVVDREEVYHAKAVDMMAAKFNAELEPV